MIRKIRKHFQKKALKNYLIKKYGVENGMKAYNYVLQMSNNSKLNYRINDINAKK